MWDEGGLEGSVVETEDCEGVEGVKCSYQINTNRRTSRWKQVERGMTVTDGQACGRPPRQISFDGGS